MATAAGEGAAASYEGGGAGGKFRKRPFRRSQTTPYDRPLTALRNPITSNNNSLFWKLMDPASKLIHAGAHRLFGVFRKRLPPPPPQRPPETNQQPRDRLQEAVPTNSTGFPEPGATQGTTLAKASDATEISELEQLLKQKTFTRFEIDRLTALLHSRTVDIHAGDEDKRDEANFLSPVSDFPRRGASTSTPLEKNMDERDNFNATILTPVVSSRVHNEDFASPAELAKAYMGNRPSKVSPSALGLRSQAPRQGSVLPNHATLLPKTPIMSVASKTANGVVIRENGFTTPRSRGRSAIYSMARTPYSRGPSSISQMGTRFTDHGYGSLSSSQSVWEHEGPSGSKQMALKRRSSVLGDDVGSIGPIRRIRQKSTLLSQGTYRSIHGRDSGSGGVQHPVPSAQRLLPMNEPAEKVSKAVEENGDANIRSSSYASVPSKSSQTATKILQHLERLTPKEKSSESRLVATSEKLPAKLTSNMLHGQALRSLENVDSSKFLQIAQDSQKSENMQMTWLPDARDSTSLKMDKFEESGPRKFVVPRNMLTPMNGDATVSIRENSPIVKVADADIKLPAEPPQKKRAFQMSAHEDSLEMDEDIHSNWPASTPVAEKEKVETTLAVDKAASTETLPEVAKTPIVLEFSKPPAPLEIKTTADSVCNKSPDSGTSGGLVVSEEKVGFTFPFSSPLNTTSQPAVLSQSSSAINEVAALKESNVLPTFSASNTNVEKVSPLVFSTNELSGLKSNSMSSPKPDSFNSSANAPSATTNAEVKTSVSDRDDNHSPQKAVDLIRNSVSSLSAVSSAASTSGIFSFALPSKNSNLNNGTLSSSPSFFSSSSPVLASSNSTNHSFNDSMSHFASSSSDTTASIVSINTASASSAGLSRSAATAPIFSFGSSVVPSTSASTVSTTSGTEITDVKANSAFGGTSLAMASTGSSLFGFSSSPAMTTANNQSQGFLFSTASGTLSYAQASTAAAPNTTFQFGSSAAAQNTPYQFGSSASAPSSGISVITSSTPGNSIFSSSNPASGNLFSSTASFGLSSAVVSSETNSGSSTSGATAPGIFGSGWQAPKSSIFGSTDSSPSTGFPFGASSTTTLATTSSAPVAFGLSNTATFGASNTSASSGSNLFSFNTAAATTSSFTSLSQPQSVFGSSTPAFTATIPGSNNNDQMSMEDSMAEDPMNSPAPTVPTFGQPSPSGFMFESTAQTQSLAKPFQFGVQPNQAASQNLSPFQASSSADFSGGGSFSLGSGGGDKSGRRMVRVNRNKNRKK